MLLGAIKGTKVGHPLTRQRRPGFSRSRIGYFARCNTGKNKERLYNANTNENKHVHWES